MRMGYNLRDELLGREDFSVLRYHPSRYRQHGGEETQVEQNGPVLRDLKVEKNGIDHREEQENRCESPGDERYKPGYGRSV